MGGRIGAWLAAGMDPVASPPDVARRPPLHRWLILGGLAWLLWVGLEAGQWFFWDFEDECQRVTCVWAEVKAGRAAAWRQMIPGALVLLIGVVVHVWEGRLGRSRYRLAGVSGAVALFVVAPVPMLFSAFISDHMVVAFGVGVALLLTMSIATATSVGHRPRLDLVVAYLCVGLSVVMVGAVGPRLYWSHEAWYVVVFVLSWAMAGTYWLVGRSPRRPGASLRQVWVADEVTSCYDRIAVLLGRRQPW